MENQPKTKADKIYIFGPISYVMHLKAYLNLMLAFIFISMLGFLTMLVLRLWTYAFFCFFMSIFFFLRLRFAVKQLLGMEDMSESEEEVEKNGVENEDMDNKEVRP